MIKKLFITNNENGFILPYVLFITAIVIIIVTANISIYRNDIVITENQLEQIKIETLFQMGRTKLKKEMVNQEEETSDVSYSFPDGIVKITINSSNSPVYKLYFTITTNNNATYTVANTLQINE